MSTYRYKGPIIRWERVVCENWEATTTAPTKEKAISNLKYRAKIHLDLERNAKINFLAKGFEQID